LRLEDEGQPPLGDWDDARAGGVTHTIRTPLEHWIVRAEAPDSTFECELRASGGPIDLRDAAIAREAAVRRYVQPCEARGAVTAGGRRRTFDGRGIRAHWWGTRATARRRFVEAISPGGGTLVSVAATRPPSATAHGDEMIGGIAFDSEAEEEQPRVYEEVRLSTVFGADGLPRTAGLELYAGGAELPERLAGEALWGTPLAVDGPGHSVSFFRWSLEGRPAWGTYEIEAGS
jgi:hypothetical protein